MQREVAFRILRAFSVQLYYDSCVLHRASPLKSVSLISNNSIFILQWLLYLEQPRLQQCAREASTV